MVAVLYADGDQMYGGWLASLVGLGLLSGEIIGGLLATPLGKVKFQMIGAVAAAFIFFACKFVLPRVEPCNCLTCTAGVAVCTPDTKNLACGLVFMGCFFVGWIENVCLSLTTIALDDQVPSAFHVSVILQF